MEKDVVLTINTIFHFKDTATKTFLVYDRPWWRVDGKGEIYQQLQTNSVDLSYITTDSPLGAIQEFGMLVI